MPAGTTGNRLVFSVTNASDSVIVRPVVSVLAAPDWIAFLNQEAAGPSIPAGQAKELVFTFDVRGGREGESGVVWLVVRDAAGAVKTVKSLRMDCIGTVTATSLLTPFPNPSNPETCIPYTLLDRGHVGLKVYNALGRKVRTLVDAEQNPGYREALWDGRDDEGVPVSSGVYVARMTVMSGGAVRGFTAKILVGR